MNQSFTRQGCSAVQLAEIAASFIPAELTPCQKAARDWDLAHKLDRRGDAYQTEGNEKMAAVCRSRALAASIRATEFDRQVASMGGAHA